MITLKRTFDPRRIKLLIFDLDGTLIDSRLDLANSVNAMLRHFRRPELPADEIVSCVGDGAHMLVLRVLGCPQDERFVAEALAYFLRHYRRHTLDHTRAYEGITGALADIAAPHQGSRRKMAVLSNKPAELSRGIINGLGLDRFFVAVYGGDSFATKKPDPLGVREILKENGTSPDEALMVGDSLNDVLTGRNAGLWTCGVSYGFAPHALLESAPDVLVDTPRELADLLRAANAPAHEAPGTPVTFHPQPGAGGAAQP